MGVRAAGWVLKVRSNVTEAYVQRSPLLITLSQSLDPPSLPFKQSQAMLMNPKLTHPTTIQTVIPPDNELDGAGSAAHANAHTDGGNGRGPSAGWN